VNTFSALQNSGKGPNHQGITPSPLRKSKQHFTTHHFFNADKSRMEIPILTFSAASASMRRCLSNRNISLCQIKWSTVSPVHTHIRSSNIHFFGFFLKICSLSETKNSWTNKRSKSCQGAKKQITIRQAVVPVTKDIHNQQIGQRP
jgi:hypothetical protein